MHNGADGATTNGHYCCTFAADPDERRTPKAPSLVGQPHRQNRRTKTRHLPTVPRPGVQPDRLSFLPGEEIQVDYGEGAPTLVPGSDRYKKPRLFVATLRHSRRSFRRVVWKSSQQV